MTRPLHVLPPGAAGVPPSGDLELLRMYAIEDERKPGHWILRTPSGVSRPGPATAAFIRACLYLGIPVSDVLTTDLVVAIASRLYAVEAAVRDVDGLS
jgi:hypothetical protein